jgi:hypothetical protein
VQFLRFVELLELEAMVLDLANLLARGDSPDRVDLLGYRFPPTPRSSRGRPPSRSNCAGLGFRPKLKLSLKSGTGVSPRIPTAQAPGYGLPWQEVLGALWRGGVNGGWLALYDAGECPIDALRRSANAKVAQTLFAGSTELRWRAVNVKHTKPKEPLEPRSASG